ncbi:alcohol dehydrogenase-like regulatory protein ErcA [Methanospirillum lacunae]|uniref:Alcohol dehydrogenase n=1 Tax=Methanospirillum lacunae TaxID=668570 RepID=A0A2V2N2W0_9EURY|nr:alcohol dehydrogenase-like regulatory protein ErcA [Methanospirillum lacunae]PWR74492.1 alcohol dehydrogenase [Methanospirillum lacunae]
MTDPSVFELRKFVAPEIVYGDGARFLAGRFASIFQAEKILVVTDPGIIASGITAEILESLDEAGIRYSVFSDIVPNPHAESVMEGARIYKDNHCTGIIAVGGGSPIDCAKGIGIVSSNNRHILEFEGVDMVEIPAPPLICIPTTSGSSADVSQFAIISDKARKVKIAIISKTLVPDVALIDPSTLMTLGPDLTLHTVLDALTHAIEAYVSNAHSSITDIHALEAIRLVWSYLPLVMQDPTNLEYRSYTMLASMHAGLAFSNASLGAVHAMAHSLGGFLDLPHGMCNAMLLPAVIRFNYQGAQERYDTIAKVMGIDMTGSSGEARGKLLISTLLNFYHVIGFSSNLSEAGVKKSHLMDLADKAMTDACMVTNPRQIEREDLLSIYESAL